MNKEQWLTILQITCVMGIAAQLMQAASTLYGRRKIAQLIQTAKALYARMTLPKLGHPKDALRRV